MEQNKELLSIIIPVYNIMDCLERCVVSVMNQTYSNIEILLIDDGSTDGTGALCDQLGKRDERIKVFHKENGGSSSARNLGLHHATGEYIGFVDSDDYIEPDMYELLLQTIYKYHVPMAQISRDEIDERGHRSVDVCIAPKQETLMTAREMMEELLMHRGDCSFCTRLTHRSLFENRTFPEGKLNEDFFLLTNMLQEIKEFVILPEQYYHVFYRVGSNTRKKDKNEFPRVFMDIVDNADMVMEIVKSTYPDLEQVCIRFNFYQRLDYLLHIPVALMKRSNTFYRDVCKYLKRNVFKMVTNPYLSKKNKMYLLLFTIAPRLVRVVHAKVRHIQ